MLKYDHEESAFEVLRKVDATLGQRRKTRFREVSMYLKLQRCIDIAITTSMILYRLSLLSNVEATLA